MESERVLIVPRGTPASPRLSMDMTKVSQAEKRIHETKTVNLLTVAELTGTFNEACSLVTKYLAWVKFELLQANKYLELARAEVLIDKVPMEIMKLKDRGVKDTADIREAFVVRDPAFQEAQNRVFMLEASKLLLEAKQKMFDRAYWDCRNNSDDKGKSSASVSTSLREGELSNENLPGFMGVSKL